MRKRNARTRENCCSGGHALFTRTVRRDATRRLGRPTHLRIFMEKTRADLFARVAEQNKVRPRPQVRSTVHVLLSASLLGSFSLLARVARAYNCDSLRLFAPAAFTAQTAKLRTRRIVQSHSSLGFLVRNIVFGARRPDRLHRLLPARTGLQHTPTRPCSKSKVNKHAASRVASRITSGLISRSIRAPRVRPAPTGRQWQRAMRDARCAMCRAASMDGIA